MSSQPKGSILPASGRTIIPMPEMIETPRFAIALPGGVHQGQLARCTNTGFTLGGQKAGLLGHGIPIMDQTDRFSGRHHFVAPRPRTHVLIDIEVGGQNISSQLALSCLTFSTTHAKEIMPTYHVEMLEGRTIEQKKKLVEAITRVTVEVLGGTPDAVDILITDVKRENWATGGVLWTEPRS